MNIRFNLKSKDTQKTLILLKSRYLKGAPLPFVYSTGQKIDPKFWDHYKMRAKASITEKRKKVFNQEAIWLNALLDKYEAEALNFLRRSLVENSALPSHKELKNHLNSIFKTDQKQVKALDFLELFQESINKKDQSSKYADSTVKVFKRAKKRLEEFSKDRAITITLKTINRDLFADFQQYLFSKNYAKNTVASYWKKIKVILNELLDEEILTKPFWRSKKLALSFQEGTDVYLNPKELMKIYDLDLKGSYLEKYRDSFLLAAFTGGFRYSDLAQIDEGNIIEDNSSQGKIVQLHTKKTDSKILVPGGWYFNEFQEKYKNGFPDVSVNQVFNRNIKEFAKKAGLTQPVKLRKNKGGQNITVTKPKYKWISQYTARYSFATNLYCAGVSLAQIGNLLGHKKVSTTKGYIKAQRNNTIMSIAKNPYFTDKPKTKKVVPK